MDVLGKLDELGKPGWIALTVLGFALWWPAGLAILLFGVGSGRMSCGKRGFGRWMNCGKRGEEGGQFRPAGRWGQSGHQPSGNRAFDEYRSETLRRLEEEQGEFRDFLDRLRFARDRAEFDQFMAERRRRAEGQAGQPQQS